MSGETISRARRAAGLKRVRYATARAKAAAAERDAAIRNAHVAGATLRAIATEAGLTPGRIHQILREPVFACVVDESAGLADA